MTGKPVRKVFTAILILLIIIALMFLWNEGMLSGKVYLKNIGYVDVSTEELLYPDSSPEFVIIDWRIKRLTKLKSLSLEVAPSDDLSFLKDMEALENLMLKADYDNIESCTFDTLPGIDSLKTLALYYFANEDMDCSPLGQLTSLEAIDVLTSCVYDWSFTEELVNLKKINIDQGLYLLPPEKYDWSSLGAAQTLEEFKCRRLFYDRALLEALGDMPSLKKADIHFGDHGDLDDEEKEFISEWVQMMTEKGVTVVYDGDTDQL